MNKILMFALCLFLMMPLFAQDKDGKYVVEASKFTLTDCQIVTDAKASSGKAVKLLKSSATGTYEMKLPKGDYTMSLNMNGPDGDHDALVMKANDAQIRTYPDHVWGSYVTAFKTLNFTVGDDGKVVLSFKAAEIEMFLDTFVIVKAAPAASSAAASSVAASSVAASSAAASSVAASSAAASSKAAVSSKKAAPKKAAPKKASSSTAKK
jgi:hypothetical protein